MGTNNTTIWTGLWGRLGGRKLESEGRVRELGGLLDRIDLDGGEVVLDLGAGPGLVTLALAERLTSGRVIGLDLSADMQDRLRDNAAARGLSERVRLVLADATETGLDDVSVDLVVSNVLLHEVTDLGALLAEIRRLLRPGGHVLLRDFRRSLVSRAMVRVFHGTGVVGPLTSEQLDRALRAAGFDEVEVVPDRWAHIGSGRRPS